MAKFTKDQLITALESLGACSQAVFWVERNTITSPKELWLKCPWPDWLMWIAGQAPKLLEKKFEVWVDWKAVELLMLDKSPTKLLLSYEREMIAELAGWVLTDFDRAFKVMTTQHREWQARTGFVDPIKSRLSDDGSRYPDIMGVVEYLPEAADGGILTNLMECYRGRGSQQRYKSATPKTLADLVRKHIAWGPIEKYLLKEYKDAGNG